MYHFLPTHMEAHDQVTQSLIMQIVELLENAYFAELETAINYIALLNNLTGLEAEPIKELLRGEIQDEFRHAQEIANRIRVLGFKVPNALAFRRGLASAGQEMLSKASNLESAIKAIVVAESEAMDLYKQIICLAGEMDPATADLATKLLADEEGHFRTFNNLL